MGPIPMIILSQHRPRLETEHDFYLPGGWLSMSGAYVSHHQAGYLGCSRDGGIPKLQESSGAKYFVSSWSYFISYFPLAKASHRWTQTQTVESKAIFGKRWFKGTLQGSGYRIGHSAWLCLHSSERGITDKELWNKLLMHPRFYYCYYYYY